MAGVSVRTLHLYDEMGLLKPSIRTEKKYRLYGKAEAIRLQQILFYKVLGMPLKEIAEHYELIREFWGTPGSPDKQADAYAGLGDLYVTDERYTTVNGAPSPKFAQFMNQAMKHFAKRLKQLE